MSLATIVIFLSSGLFLGWSMGANDAANVFGTAVGARMVRFRTAALICSVCVILGAVLAGGGATKTLGRLGGINAMAGAFTVALAAALTVFSLIRLSFPVSISQTVVGAIVGWNIFCGKPTDFSILSQIVGVWILCPFLAGLFAVLLYFLVKWLLNHTRIHIIRQDSYTRLGLILVGAFGSYSLGANNIANVMGVFAKIAPFKALSLAGLITLSPQQQLFFLGGVSIAVGVYTYSRKVMKTVGNDLYSLSPVAALIVVLASSMVLFLFASQDLQNFFHILGLPSLPLAPVSSSQAVVGGILGVGAAKNWRNINVDILGRISLGWFGAPLIAGLAAYVLLFFVQNVFMQRVFS